MKEKTISIITPEKIRFNYQVSELGTRIAAYCFDTIVQFVIIIVFLITIFFTSCMAVFSFGGQNNWIYFAATFFVLALFFLQWFYYVLFEVIMDGQSPGKKIFKIRVIKTNGEPLDFQTIVVRNLIRIVDAFPVIHSGVLLIGTYLVGGFITLIDKRSRRLGDLIAKTIVVNDIHYDLAEPDFSVKLSSGEKSLADVPLVTKLNEDELYIIRRFLNERDLLPSEKREEVAQKLAQQVADKLNIEYNTTNAVRFLENVYKEHGTED